MYRWQWLIWMAMALGGMVAGADPAIYKWRDAGGGVHYGDRPPPEAGARRLPDCDGRPCGLNDYRDAPGRGRAIRAFLEARERIAHRRAAETAAQGRAWEEEIARRRAAAEREGEAGRRRPPRARRLK